MEWEGLAAAGHLLDGVRLRSLVEPRMGFDESRGRLDAHPGTGDLPAAPKNLLRKGSWTSKPFYVGIARILGWFE